MDGQQKVLLLPMFLLLGYCINRVFCFGVFLCQNEQPFCRWDQSELTDWETAYRQCTISGGSLLSHQHNAYTDEWMRSIPNTDRVWTSLRMVNHRFQWQYQQPKYLPILIKNWIPGHPMQGRDCVVANNNTQYESVFCNSLFPAICVIEQNHINKLDSLVHPESTGLKVKLLRSAGSAELVESEHLNYDREETMLKFKCDVSGRSGGRDLVYSWIKDGVYLGNNGSDLVPSQVNDESKQKSLINGIYQKQGTYQCQVREFGSVNAVTSNAILLTYRRIYNGVLTLSLHNPLIDVDSVMERITKSIDELAKSDDMKMKLTTAWDPLFQLVGPNGIEYRHSLYVDLSTEHDGDGHLQHTLDAISKEIANTELHHRLGVKSASVSWTTYCPKEMEFLPEFDFTIQWKSSWSSKPAIQATEDPSQQIHCVQKNHTSKLPTRQCVHDFTRGAALTPIDLTKCNRVVGPLPNYRCLPGYQFMANLNICYRVTKTGNWKESLATCFNNFPVESIMENVDYSTLLNVAEKLQAAGESDLWLPVRRSSIYGPFLYYHTTNQETMEIGGEENWIGNLEEEECQILTSKEGVKTTNCSGSSLPSICVYKPKEKKATTLDANLCPGPWRGHRIHQNRLVCFSLVTLNSTVNWTEAEQVCRREKPEFAITASMATFEDYFKTQLWELVRPFWTRSRGGTDTAHSLLSAFIGVSWSEKHKKFCWTNQKDCLFDFFNWNPSASDGQFGTMNYQGSWGLMPNKGLRTQVLCEATIDLAIHRDIQINTENKNSIKINVVQSDHWTDLAPKSYANLSQFLALEQRSWTNFPSFENLTNLRCLSDGHFLAFIQHLSSEVPVSHNSSLNSWSVHCEGFIGWPRRFVRSQDLWVKRVDSEIFLLTLEANRTDDWNSVDFQSLSNRELHWRMEDFHFNGIDVRTTAVRWNISGSRLQILSRMEVIAGPENSRSEQNWLQLIRNVLLQTHFQSTYRVIEMRSTVACPEVTEMNNTWNSVLIGQFAEPLNPCVTSDGQPALIRTCLGSPSTGAYWSPITTDKNCSPPSKLLLSLRELTKQTLSGNMDSADALNQLAALGSEWEEPSAAELSQAVRVMEAGLQSTVGSSGFHNASQSLVYMMQSSKKQLQGAQSIAGISDALVTSLEQIMGQVDLSETFQHPKLVVESLSLSSKTDQMVVGFAANVKDNVIRNSSHVLDTHTPEELVTKDVVVLLPMNEIKQRFESASRLSFSLLATADLIDARPLIRLAKDSLGPEYVMGSPIIVAQVGNRSISNLSENVLILFRSAVKQQLRPVCVFWDKEASGWSTSGCRYSGTINQDLHICECNHLTPLAILIPYFEVSKQDAIGLAWISMIGCAVSMISLSMVILTFLIFNKWRQSLGNKILFNLSTALFGLVSSFLAADYFAFDDSRLCKAISVCIHYFLLSSFGWMLVEGIYQFMTYVIVVGASSYKSRFMRKAAPLTWGLPLVPIIALLIYDSSLYIGQPNFCWMGIGEAFYSAVLAPLAAVLLANVIIYIIILKSVLCFKVNLRTNQSQARRTWYQLRLALCVFFLLGLSWIFGFLTIVPEAHFVFAYLFCIFSSFQGFAIFVFFVLRERNARKLWTEFASFSDDHNSFSNTRKTHAYPSRLPTNISTNNHLPDYSPHISSPKENSKYFY